MFNVRYIYLFNGHGPAVCVNDDDTVSKLHHNNNNMAAVSDFNGSVNNMVCSSCKLKTDGNSDAGHVASDNTNSSCIWDTEDVSISRLHLG